MPPPLCLPLPKKTSPTSKTSPPTHPHGGKNSCRPPWKFRLVDPATPPKTDGADFFSCPPRKQSIQNPKPGPGISYPFTRYLIAASVHILSRAPRRLHRSLVWPSGPPQGHPPSSPPQGPRPGKKETLLNSRNFKHHDVGRTLPTGDQDMLPCG